MAFKSLDAMPKAVRGVTAEEVTDAKAAMDILNSGKVLGSDTYADVDAARAAGTRLRNVISSLGFGKTLKLRTFPSLDGATFAIGIAQAGEDAEDEPETESTDAPTDDGTTTENKGKGKGSAE